MAYKAEYIWIDGTQPTAKLRSKTKIVPTAASRRSGASTARRTNQAPGSRSDCVLKPVFVCPDPIRGGDNKLVMCEVLLTDMTPHPTNTRARLRGDRRQGTRTTTSGSASSRSTPSSTARGRSAGRTAASRRPRAATTAASAPTRSSAAPSSRRTWTPASRPA